MRKFYPLLAQCSFALLLLTANDCGGIYRWDNKILIDAPGLTLFNKKATTSTIHSIVNITRPPNSQLGPNRSTDEMRKVTVTALIVGLGKEGDNDYHLILTSTNQAESMIDEFTDPRCQALQD